MVDVAKLQIQVDSQPVLTAAQNLAALSSSARRTEAVLSDVGSKKPFASFNAKDAEKSFSEITGVVNNFAGRLETVQSEFTEFGTSVGNIGKNLGSIGDSFTKLGDGLAKIAEAGGTKSLGKVVGAIKQIETSSSTAAGPVERVATAMKTLRESASGISTSGNSFKTSLSNLVQPASSAAGKLERAATAAAALSATIRRIGNQGGGNAKIQNVGKTAAQAGAAFRELTGPLGKVVGEIGGFQAQLATIVSGIGESASGIGKVKTQFETISNSIALLGDKSRLNAIVAVASALIGYGKAARRAVGPLKTLVEQTRQLREASSGLTGRYNRFTSALEGLISKVEPAATGVGKLGEVAGTSLQRFEKLEQTIRELRNEVSRLQAQTGRRGGLRKIANEAEAAGNSIARAGRQSRVASQFIRQFATGLGLVGGGFAAALGARAFVETLADFEFQAAKTSAVAIKLGTAFSEAAAQAKALEDQARSLGASTRFTAVEAAEAQFFLARAGFEVNEVLEATPDTLNLAAAGYVDLGEAADIASNVLQQFSLETFQLVEVTDALVSAANNSNTSVRQLAQALAYSGPFASSLGVSVDEATAAIGALGNAGIQGSLAGTNLRGILISLVSPSRKAGETLDKLAGRIGETRDAFNVSTQGLENVVRNLRRATEGTEDASAVFAQIFNRRNVSGALALTKNIEQFSELLETIGLSAGEAKRIADQVDNTLTGAFKRARSAAAELALSLGDRGVGVAFREVTEAIAGALRFLSGSEEGLKGLTSQGLIATKAIRSLAAAIAGLVGGAALLGFTSVVASATLSLAQFATGSVAAARGLAALRAGWLAFSATNPIALLVTAATATIAWTTDLFGLLSATNDEAEALGKVNEQLQGQIDLREKLDNLRAQATTAAEASVRAARLAAGGAELSTTAAEGSRALALLDRSIAETTASGGKLGATLETALDISATAENIRKGAEVLEQALAPGGDRSGLPSDLQSADDELIRRLIERRRAAAEELETINNDISSGLRERLKDVDNFTEAELLADKSVGEFTRDFGIANATFDRGDLLEALTGANALRERLTSEVGKDLAISITDPILEALFEISKRDDLFEAEFNLITGLPTQKTFDAIGGRVTLLQQAFEEFGFSGAGADLSNPEDLARFRQIRDVIKGLNSEEKEILSTVVKATAEEKQSIDLANARRDLSEETLLSQLKSLRNEKAFSGLSGERLKFAKERIKLEDQFQEKAEGGIDLATLSVLKLREFLALQAESDAATRKQQAAADNVVGRIAEQVTLGQLALEDKKREVGLIAQSTAESRAEARARRELLKINVENADILEDTRKRLTDFFLQLEQQAQEGLLIDLEFKLGGQVEEAEAKLAKLRGTSVELSASQKAINALNEIGVNVYSDQANAVFELFRQLEKLNKLEQEQVVENNIESLEQEVALLGRKVAGYKRLAVEQQTDIFLQKEGANATNEQILRIRELIQTRETLKTRLEQQQEEERKRQERERATTEAIVRSQQDLSAALTDVVFGARSAEEAFAGFVEQLGRAILQAQIFKALGPLFKEGGLIATAVEAGVQPDPRAAAGSSAGDVITESAQTGRFGQGLPSTGSVSVDVEPKLPDTTQLQRTVQGQLDGLGLEVQAVPVLAQTGPPIELPEVAKVPVDLEVNPTSFEQLGGALDGIDSGSIELSPLPAVPVALDVDTSSFEQLGGALDGVDFGSLAPLTPEARADEFVNSLGAQVATLGVEVPVTPTLPPLGEFRFPQEIEDLASPPSVPLGPTLPAQLDDGVGGLLPTDDSVIAARLALTDRAELDLADQLGELEELAPAINLTPSIDKDEYLNNLFEISGGEYGQPRDAGLEIPAPVPTDAIPAAQGIGEVDLIASATQASTTLTTAGSTIATSVTTGASTGAATLIQAGTALATSITTAAVTAAATLSAASIGSGAAGGEGSGGFFSGFLDALKGAAGGGESYKGNVVEDGIIKKEYYSGGVPGLDELPKTGGIPATFRGADGSLNTLREGGSQEAILPLGRDGQGRLGVRMVGMNPSNSQTSNTTTNSTVNNNVTNVTVSGGGSNSAGLNSRQIARQASKRTRRR
jgi:TP901 family phage tail tape measure protein